MYSKPISIIFHKIDFDGLTRMLYHGKLSLKLNRISRGAIYISRLRSCQAACVIERICRRSLWKMPVFQRLVRQEIPAGLSQQCGALFMEYPNIYSLSWTAASMRFFFCWSIVFIKRRKNMKNRLRILMALILSLVFVLSFTGCKKNGGSASGSDIKGLEDGKLTIAMECAYAPYNWTQFDDSNGAVPIKDTNGEYANGYDIMIAKKICEANDWELEVIRTDWDSLVPGVQTGMYDAVIAGQSMTESRSKQVDFAGPYYYASIVCVTKKDSAFANAKGLKDLAGGSCTAQLATIWYDAMLPQIPDANIQTAAESAPAMLMALESNIVDFICTDLPTAQGAVAAYDDMMILDFTGSDDNFEADEGEINIGISMMKGNTGLKDAIDSVLKEMTADDFTALMAEAINVQPLSE